MSYLTDDVDLSQHDLRAIGALLAYALRVMGSVRARVPLKCYASRLGEMSVFFSLANGGRLRNEVEAATRRPRDMRR